MSETNLALGSNLHMCRWYHIYMQTVYENIRKKSILKKLAKSERGR